MYRLLVITALLCLPACGPDSELVASGKIHTCHIQGLQAQVAADPSDQAAQAALLDRAALLQAVIETADPGSREALAEAIREAALEGCP